MFTKKLKALILSIMLLFGVSAGLFFLLPELNYYYYKKNMIKYIIDNDYENVEKLIKEKNSYSVNFLYDNVQPLFLSISVSEVLLKPRPYKIAHLLLENKADPNACIRGWLEEDGKKLIFEKSVLLNLIINCSKDNKESANKMIHTLLKLGANPDFGEKLGDEMQTSPLLEAAMRGNFGAMKLLVEYHADINRLEEGFMDVLSETIRFVKHYIRK